MESINKVIALPGAKNLLFFIGLIILVWLCGPLLSFNGTQPFSSVENRFILTAFIIALSLLRLLIDLLIKYNTQAWSKFKEFFVLWNNKFKEISMKIIIGLKNKFSYSKGQAYQDKQGRKLRKLPWYLVVGPRGSGKTSLIAKSGIGLKPPEQLGQQALNYLQQYPDYDWWFGDDSVFIDITCQAPITKDEKSINTVQQQKTWQNFIKLLYKNRKAKPISGIILTFNVTELLLKDNKARQAEIYDVFLQVRQISSVCKVQLPIYIIFTKADLIEGFVEFFNDLSKEELEQVWGITLPLADSIELNSVISVFSREFQRLIDCLNEKTLWKIEAEKQLLKRELIFSFPQQMTFFKKSIENFISEIFGAVRQPKAIQLRGIYFTSTAQKGAAHDFISTVFHKKFNLNSTVKNSEIKQNQETYFLDVLFKKVILNDSKVLGYSNKVRTFRSVFYRVIMTLLPSFAVLGIITASFSYAANRQYIKIINQNLKQYQQYYKMLDINDADIINTLPLLNTARAIQRVYADTTYPKIIGIFPSAHYAKNAANTALIRSIDAFFLPRVAVHLENILRQPNMNDNILYSVFKAYLSFSPVDATPADSLIQPMHYLWEHAYQKNTALTENLAFYLQQAVDNNIEALPLDRNLIDKVRDDLAHIFPAYRAYELLLLKAALYDFPPLNFNQLYRPLFNQVFTSLNSTNAIPALYTKVGYEEIFLKHYLGIVQQVVDDNKEIGLTATYGFPYKDKQSQLITQLQKEYTRRYVQQWQTYLEEFSVRPFTNYQIAINILTLLLGEQSVLVDVLTTIQTNTMSVNFESVTVSDNFQWTQLYSDLQTTSEKMLQINKILNDLKTYLTSIQQAANVDQAAFNAVKNYMSGTLEDPLRQVILVAEQAPQPLRNWLSSIADHSWALMLQGTVSYINDAWVNEVISAYDSELRGRYPFDSTASSQVSVQAFSSFFMPQGTFAKFFDTYLKVFIDTSKPNWQLYRLNGYGLAFNQQELTLFQQTFAIQKMFFSEGHNTPSLQFALKPYTLDSNAKNIVLSLAGQNINYSHGPQQAQTISWPISIGQQAIQISIQDFDDNNYFKNYYGPWALFQLFGNGKIRYTTDPNQYLFDINLPPYNASFNILTTQDLALFQLRYVKNYHLPGALLEN